MATLGLLMNGVSCVHRQQATDPIELRPEERSRLESLALAFVASVRAGDSIQAKRLTVDGSALKNFVDEDSALVWSKADVRSATQLPGYLSGDHAELGFVFVSAPVSSRCPHDADGAIRTFIFRRRHGEWLIEKVIIPFC